MARRPTPPTGGGPPPTSDGPRPPGPGAPRKAGGPTCSPVADAAPGSDSVTLSVFLWGANTVVTTRWIRPRPSQATNTTCTRYQMRSEHSRPTTRPEIRLSGPALHRDHRHGRQLRDRPIGAPYRGNMVWLNDFRDRSTGSGSGGTVRVIVRPQPPLLTPLPRPRNRVVVRSGWRPHCGRGARQEFRDVKKPSTVAWRASSFWTGGGWCLPAPEPWSRSASWPVGAYRCGGQRGAGELGGRPAGEMPGEDVHGHLLPCPAPVRWTASAMSARSAVVSSTSGAPIQPSTWPGSRAPTIAAVTPG